MFQVVQSIGDHGARVAQQAGNLVSIRETCLMLVHKRQNIPLSRRGKIQAGQAVPNFKIEIFVLIHSVVDGSGPLFFDRRDLL